MVTRSIYRNTFRWVALGMALALAGNCNAIINRFTGNGVHDVDLKDAIWLKAVPEATTTDKEGVPADHGGTTTPVDNLFSLPPGTQVKASALGGAIDPTGTTIVNDFDGDGILNANETTTNVWVADYPVVEAVVATPVTMKIRVDVSVTGSSDEIVSEITSDDAQTNKTEGSEKIHQSELNLRTVQFQDSFASSNEISNSTSSSTSGGANFSYGAGMGALAIAGGMNYAHSTSQSWAAKNSTSETTTKWADKPFKNNLDRDAWSVKSDISAQKARKYRKDITTKTNTTSKIDANAGYVRAPLFIKNLSVNMPVHLTNILCSLMFETPGGELIPVQSFRLRNDDYSLFSVDVYGGSEFGPYVIELNGLNTSEVQNAIAQGYSPKIFIVDYEMTHVADSNYRSMLLNFSGNNLKIVEENSKGRTAQIKVFGPGMREKFRVAAFSTNNGGDPCQASSASTMAPGISLKDALARIACSGLEVQYEDYVIDLSEIAPTLGEPRMHIRGIKSLGGIQTTIPCVQGTYTGSDGVSRTACIQKPYEQWTDTEKKTTGVWAIYSIGKYYSPTDYWKDGSLVRRFDPSVGAKSAMMVKGIDSTVWAGDYYDIVYISFKDLIAKEETHGSNPLETQFPFDMNTRWNLSTMGDRPYDPDTRSTFLGQVGFGEQIELTIKLNGTTFLNPKFGAAEDSGTFESWADFSYGRSKSSLRFSIDQAADFEISMGFGGARSDWYHVVKDLDNTDPYLLKNCGRTLDYVAQTYTLCVQLPTAHAYVDPAVSLVRLYVRPSMNSAYRETIWPLPYSQVRRMRGELGAPVAVGDLSVNVARPMGPLASGDRLYIEGDTTGYDIASVVGPAVDGTYTVTLASAISHAAVKTTAVYVPGTLSHPDVTLVADKAFTADWNAESAASFMPDQWNIAQHLPLLQNGSINCSTQLFHPGCLGFSVDYRALNWMGSSNGGVAAWNSWSDGGTFDRFLSGGLLRLSTQSGRSYRLEAYSKDFSMSQATGAAPYTEPYALVGSDSVLLVWKRDTLIKGRWFGLHSGSPEGNEFAINTATVTGRFVAKAAGGKAVIAWESNDKVYYIVKDLFSRATLGTETLAGSFMQGQRNGYGISPTGLDVAVGSNKAAVVWVNTRMDWDYGAPIPWQFGCPPFNQCYHINYTNTAEVLGRLVTLDTGAPDAGILTIWSKATTLVDRAERSELKIAVAASGDFVSVVRHYRNTYHSTDWELSADAVRLADGALIGSRVLASGSSSISLLPMLEASGTDNRALFSWLGSDGVLLARGMDAANGVLLGTANVTVDDAVLEGRMSGVSSTGMITYTKNSQVYLKAFDLNDGQPRNSNGVVLGNQPASSRTPGRSYVDGNLILTTWEQADGGLRTIRGRLVNTANYSAIGMGEFMISTTNQGNQSGPVAVVDGSVGMVFWLAQDSDQPRIRGHWMSDLASPGSLEYGLNNFFVAPLIERDYTIKARIKY